MKDYVEYGVDVREYIDKGATFDEARVHRYLLWRRWSTGTLVLWIMLNPSTADERKLDPTLRRCQAFTCLWGHAGFMVANAFAFRSPDPKDLYGQHHEHEQNDVEIVKAAERAAIIVVGWGKEKIAQDRAMEIQKLLTHRTLYCLGTNKDGSPKHPLYLPSLSPLKPWKDVRL